MLYYKMKKTNFYRSRKLCFLEEKELTISLISVFKLAFDVSFPEPDFLKKRFRSKKIINIKNVGLNVWLLHSSNF